MRIIDQYSQFIFMNAFYNCSSIYDLTDRLNGVFICLSMAVLYIVCVLIFAIAKIPQPGKCLIKEAIFRVNEKEYLPNYVIETKQAESELECGIQCVAKESCASVNYKTSGAGKGLCELNSKPSRQEVSKRLHQPEFNLLYIVKEVSEYERELHVHFLAERVSRQREEIPQL